MAKQPTLPDNIIEVKTTVTYQGEATESAVRINIDDLAQIGKNHGPKAANTALQKVVDSVYEKTNNNIKSLINK